MIYEYKFLINKINFIFDVQFIKNYIKILDGLRLIIALLSFGVR